MVLAEVAAQAVAELVPVESALRTPEEVRTLLDACVAELAPTRQAPRRRRS